MASMLGIKKVFYSGRTKYQEVVIAELHDFGLALILDGKVQSSQYDEFIYHEMLVHPALISHPNPQEVLLIGGAEGATLREILRHSTVRRAVMVDIDEEVVKICKEHLRVMHQGSFDDPRISLVIGDGREYLKENEGGWDVIVMDVTDPIEGGPSKYLYTKEFYRIAYEKLNEDGVLVTQATSMFQNLNTFSVIYRTLGSVFPHVRATSAFVPVYTANWAFVIASKALDPMISSDLAVKRVKERGVEGLKYYDPERHPYYFHLPPFVLEHIEKEERIALDESPVYIY
jgi:spermidine synthase